MRRTYPLIIGAGPAGCAAAVSLARHGIAPLLIDRDREVRDTLCGGFLSWRTVEQLVGYGVDPVALGASPIDRLAIFTGGELASFDLPARAYGLSRRTLDKALRERALALGARLEIDTVRKIEGDVVEGQKSNWRADGIFLASGKHDVRGFARTLPGHDPCLGLRLRLPPSAVRSTLLSRTIELHLFDGGYAGIVLQEDGSINVCAAVRKSALAAQGGKPSRLFETWMRRSEPFAARITGDWEGRQIDAVGHVPYGWSASDTSNGLYRLGDQAAVIPSLAGEGISIALLSAELASHTWLARGADGASQFQSAFRRRVARPMASAGFARKIAESPLAARLGLAIASRIPGVLRIMMNTSRIRADASLAPRPASP